MGQIRDSSELKEAARILDGILAPMPAREPVTGQEASAEEPLPEAVPEADLTEERAGLPGYEEYRSGGTRFERIDAALELMCMRGGYEGAALLGDEGFVVASRNMACGEPEIAGICSRLSDALDLMGSAFGGPKEAPMVLSHGGKTAAVSFIDAGGARFALAGFSGGAEPDARELAAAAAHVAGLLS